VLGKKDEAMIVYTPVVGSVRNPLLAGIREFVPPPPSSSCVSTVPSGRRRKRKVSSEPDDIEIAICWPVVPLNVYASKNESSDKRQSPVLSVPLIVCQKAMGVELVQLPGACVVKLSE